MSCYSTCQTFARTSQHARYSRTKPQITTLFCAQEGVERVEGVEGVEAVEDLVAWFVQPDLQVMD